jgi:hypothetical protein
MRNKEIPYASITRNLRVTEFRWKPYLKTKGGHPQFKSAPPQLRNIADNQIDC